MNKYKGEFHRWIIEEWKQKDEPVVWESLSQAVLGKAGNRMRLWEYEHGKHYVKHIKYMAHKWYAT